jgi:hypothetical protein
MDILRVPPYPIVTSWDAPSANTEYTFYIEDLVDHSFETTTITSNAQSKVLYTIPQTKLFFDRKFLVRLLDDTEHIVLEDNLDILRPYADPNKLGSTASEIAEYKNYELIARSIIDTIVVDGFYNIKHVVQGTGEGTDYFSIWEDFNRVLKVYENNVLVYDIDTPEDNIFDFSITLDNSAVQHVRTDSYNRIEQGPVYVAPAFGDLANIGSFRFVDFPKGYDYTFILDVGYKTIPPDVEVAVKYLIEDIKCGKLDYYKRYVTGYNTDQFRIQFDKAIFEGTGNLVVDKILDKYLKNLVKPGLL